MIRSVVIRRISERTSIVIISVIDRHNSSGPRRIPGESSPNRPVIDKIIPFT
jgi:hypothetical protein